MVGRGQRRGEGLIKRSSDKISFTALPSGCHQPLRKAKKAQGKCLGCLLRCRAAAVL